MKLTPAQLRKKIEAAIDHEKSFIEHCKTSRQHDNPQIIEMRNRAEGTLSAFEAVLDAMKGDTCSLNTYVKGTI